MSKLCIPLVRPDFALLARLQEKADLIEFRIDLWPNISQDDLVHLRKACFRPVIFKMVKPVFSLLDLSPEYVDFSHETPFEIFEETKKCFPQIKTIISWHQFQGESSIKQWKDIYAYPADIFKIAIHVNSSLEALKLFQFAKGVQKPTIAIGMGYHGSWTRILAPCVEAPFMYAPLEEADATAEGQILVDELEQTYRFRSLNPSTHLYGLIGNPVSHSPSHRIHNFVFKSLDMNAVYVKIPLLEEELEEFLSLAKEGGFRGFSVTMPLKEAASACIRNPQQAINTLWLNEGSWKGKNTDGKGALNAIEKRSLVKGKHLLILGAGGTAAGIAQEAMQRGARITILNRSAERAKMLAQSLGAEWGELSAFKEFAQKGYDILIQCTSMGMVGQKSLCISPSDLLPGKIVLDVVNTPILSPFLSHARRRGCRIISGKEMWYGQAQEQLYQWLGVKDA